MGKIAAAIPGDDYILTVRLDNGSSVTVDLKKKLLTVRFSELRDKTAFRAAATDGEFVYWPGGLSLDLGEIMEIAAE